MTKDEIVLMAKEADLWLTSDERIAAVVRFAELVIAAEREACAQVCEEIIRECCYDGEAKDVAEFLADEIRWREDSESTQGERNDSSQRD